RSRSSRHSPNRRTEARAGDLGEWSGSSVAAGRRRIAATRSGDFDLEPPTDSQRRLASLQRAWGVTSTGSRRHFNVPGAGARPPKASLQPVLQPSYSRLTRGSVSSEVPSD